MIVGAGAVAFLLNVWYLAGLYSSIRTNVERDVAVAMVNMDIDWLWHSAIAYTRNGEELPSSVAGSLENGTDTLVVTEYDNNGSERIVSQRKLIKAEAYTNQLVSEMSKQMHSQMDGLVVMDIAVADSLMEARLAERGIRPEFVAVEIIDSAGHPIVSSQRLMGKIPRHDIFDSSYDISGNNRYRVYLSPILDHILREMAGVITTTLALLLIFTLGFTYLFRTIRRLRSLEEMKEDFINNMTHELKTPISIAYSANDALLNHGAASDPSKREAYLRIAIRQIRRLGELVEGILAMSMERRKSLSLTLERLNLSEIIEDVAATQRLRNEKMIEITVDTPPEGVMVIADRTHLRQVLDNLIDNAIKYSGSTVSIKIVCSPGQLTIHDNGIGIPARSLPHIFDKFYRVPHGNRQDIKGYGIGLYYVRNILGKMGWSISATSRPGTGSTFTIRFNPQIQ